MEQCPNLLRSGHFHPLYHDAGKSGQQDNHSGTPSEYHTGKPEYHNTVISRGRYYGIYKTILYKSEIDITGNFDKINFPKPENSIIHWEQAYLSIGVSDLRA